MPEQPGPTTSTTLSANGLAFRYSRACVNSPSNRSRPGQSGTTGSDSYPVATTTWGTRDLAGGGAQRPAAVRALDPVDVRAELEVDPVLAGVVVEMLHELVSRGEHRSPLREAAPGQVGQRPAGVEA